MTIIYVTESNCQCYGVTFQNKGLIRVQKLKDVSEDKNIIYEVNPMETFLGKSEVCDMTLFSRAEDKAVFNGKTILLEIGVENNRHRYVYIGGDKVCSFLTNDRIYRYISNMGNNLTPYSIAIGFEIYIIYHHILNLLRKEKILMKMILISYSTIKIFQTIESYEYIKFIQIMNNINIQILLFYYINGE